MDEKDKSAEASGSSLPSHVSGTGLHPDKEVILHLEFVTDSQAIVSALGVDYMCLSLILGLWGRALDDHRRPHFPLFPPIWIPVVGLDWYHHRPMHGHRPPQLFDPHSHQGN